MIWEEDVYLMCDVSLLEEEQNTSMVREEAYKHKANPIIDETKKEFFLNQKGSRIWIECVCYQGGVYRMWYRFQYERKCPTECYLGYAESADGYQFTPKQVGTTTHNGSKKNNLVTISDNPDLRSSSIFYDPLDKDYPLKTVILRKGSVEDVDPGSGVRWSHKAALGHPDSLWYVWGIGKSKDGFVWELPQNKDNLVNASIEGPCIYRAQDQGYVISNQMVTRYSELFARKIKGWVTYDSKKAYRIADYLFSLPDHMTRVEGAYVGNLWDNTYWAQSHVGLVPVKKGPTIVALHGYLYGAQGTETYAQVADVGLAISSTGYSFNQIWPFRPFLRRGMRGEWDAGLVVQAAIAETEKETLLYYTGSSVGNAGGCKYRAGVGYIGKDRYGYRVLRVYRDYMKPKKRCGTIKLNPILLPEKPKISLNVSHVTKDRTVKVEIRDEAGRVIPGFSFKNCIPVTREGIRKAVNWKEQHVSKLADRKVSLSVELFSPDCQYADQHSPRVYAIYTA